MNNDRIIGLIVDKLSNQIDNEGDNVIKNWIKQSDQNEIIFNDYSKIYKDINAIKKKKLEIDINKSFLNVQSKLRKKQKLFVIKKAILTSAAILIPLLIISILFNVEKEIAYQPIPKIIPGAPKAKLILSSGKVIDLKTKNTNVIDEVGTKIVKSSDKSLNYKNIDTSLKANKYNKIIIPKGGEYSIVFSDGTKVWLNSGTELKYPVSFTGNTREVWLKGEAFFKVEKNKKKPFLVNTNDFKVRVTGTQFNVNAYCKNDLNTVLVEGGVEVISKYGKSVLKPNQKLDISHIKSKNIISNVDVKYHVSWKDGVFYFNNMKLKDLIVKLNRWYDVKFKFLDKSLGKYRFTGKVDKSVELLYILNLISQTTKVEFKYRENTIYISKK